MQLATFYFRGSGISWPKLFLLTHCLSTIVNFPFVFVRGFSVSYRSAILIAPAYQKAQFLNVLPRYFSPPSSRAPHLSLVMALASSGRNTSNVVTPIAPAKNGVANGVLTPAQKLAGLRRLMQENTIDGYIVYSADAHNSEYCRTHDERRAFISEFTGSAGIAVITMNEALLWTDGRYFQQADKELDPDLWKLMKGGLETTPTISRYIRECKQVHRLGLDMYTTSVADFQKLEKELKDEVILVPLEQNLVDSIWGKNQPSVPESTVFTVPLKYTGMEVHSKLQNIREELLRKRVQAVLLSALDEIAWTLNLRGSDVLYNPVFASYLIITAHSAKLYINEKRLDAKSKKQLEEAHVILRPYDAIMKDVSGFYSVDIQSFKFWLDPYINIAVYKSIPDADKNTILEQTPVSLPKAIKTPAELQGMREAHIKDGMAECKFFSWLEFVKKDGSLFSMTELTLSDKIDGFRAKQDTFVSLSFPSISGIGPNGAIIHYRPEKESCSTITPSMYLLDSGGQYEEGTTDVTRTTHFGTPSVYEKKCWTRVLKGHIRLARAIFPDNTKGPQLDVFARQDLWEVGLDYRHGTGHGVGCFLNVHEGPCGISPRLAGPSSTTKLLPGMVLSNEPGYYDVEFGIRIENLVIVVEADLPKTFENTPFYKFETITLIPLDRTLMDFNLLNAEEIEWINSYHKTICDTLVPRLKEEERKQGCDNSAVIAWIQRETAAL